MKKKKEYLLKIIFSNNHISLEDVIKNYIVTLKENDFMINKKDE